MNDTISRPAPNIIIVGSSIPNATPWFLTHKCAHCNCKLIVASTLKKTSAQKFNTCGTCWEAKRAQKKSQSLEQWRAKQDAMFLQMPDEVKMAWLSSCEAATEQQSARQEVEAATKGA